jgi:hypothetical protein
MARWTPLFSDGRSKKRFIQSDDSAMPGTDPAELAAWRNYLLNDGPVPLRREDR